jgi:hypothetical protein
VDWPILAGTLAWTRVFGLRTRTILNEAVGPQSLPFFCAQLVWVVFAATGSCDVWLFVLMSLWMLSAPKLTLRFFGALPLSRSRLFRPVMLGVLTIIILGCVSGLAVPHWRDRSSATMCQVAQARELPAKTGFRAIDSLFNNGVRCSVNQSHSMMPDWWERLLDRPLRVEAPSGYAKCLIVCQYDLVLRINYARYDPYEFDGNDPWAFCAYQLERYLRERHGLQISADERATWEKADPASDPYRRVAGILASTWERIAVADLKIRACHTMFLLSALWVLALGAYATSCGRRRPRKLFQWILSGVGALAVLALMTDWFMPLSRPISNAVNPLLVAYFPWIGCGFLGWTVIWFFMTERRFEKIEVSNERRLW